MYKIWYSAGETHEPNVNAYAVSTDGINWKKAKCNPIFVCDKANEYEQNRIGGCKVNQYETEAMTELYASAGYEIVPFESKADIYIINTCSVTNIGDRKSRQIIRRAKKNNPEAVIAVTGCYAQTAADEVLNIDGVNLVIGTKGRTSIVEITEGLDSNSKLNMVADIMHNHEFEDLKITKEIFN